MSDNKTLNGNSITGRKHYNELDLKEDVNMWDLSNEKHCPKCGGKMMDLVLTSYPGQSISKCWSCGYEENRRHYEEGKCKEIFPRLSEVQKVQIEFT